ncbi:acyl transferase domain-containing protein [Aspergillus cavernicola]|uniref:Acyl transferase domain-containing protein n=1 Tax=Aspergillus cavernicola TaxID=176166 RepID=A0ABR4I6Y0_9EURO
MAVFGGQGESSQTCVREFEELYNTYKPMLRRLLGVIGPCLYELSTQSEYSSYYRGQSLDLETWIHDSTTAPGLDFIASAPVSVPIIGALSLARYCVICHVAGLDPAGMRSTLHGTTGHSQGILVSIAIAMSDSWDSFYRNSQQTIEILFHLGWECHHAAPCSMVPAAYYGDGTDVNSPSYMLSVRGLSIDQAETALNHVNTRLPKEKHLCLSLVNAHDQFVIAGPVASLLHLDGYFTSISSHEKDQSRVPFSNRSSCIQHCFLPVSTPFHTHYLAQAAERIKQHFTDRVILAHQLMIPVYHTQTGLDLRQQSGSVLSIAIDAIACDRCNWPSALAAYPVSHIITFDRGGLAPLIKRVKEGWGVRVLQASDLDSRDPDTGTMRDLLSPRLLDTSRRLQSWGQRFQPGLTIGAKPQLETRLNQVLGAPPVIVAGMTPTTMHPDFVATIMNAGYHAELAGGGYHEPAAMESAIHDLICNIPSGRGITCNIIYANPRAIAWQIALIRRLSYNHVPIDGLTIGAGVPSLDVATNYIEMLGLRHISFKPGSIATIRQVVEIAKKSPEFPVILQWTGGRGGGHHSFEDFHAPIITTYGMVRQQSNIYLVAGSGFGDGDSIYPYLTGSWSVPLGHPPMPFDGVLLGSRMMVANEAHTSPAVRRKIAAIPGVSDKEWERTYTGAAGGVITVNSEMGEPIHKIATRGVRLWAELDRSVFSLSRKERIEYLTRNRHSILRRLNEDYAKPWFGCNDHGMVIDLEEMTYLEVLDRLVRLMYIQHQNRWIDPSYIDLAIIIARRWLEILPIIKDYTVCLTMALLAKSPNSFLVSFGNGCPTSGEDLLSPEDVSFFLMQCKQPGRKPVNFIPALNEDFEYYFKKDSLWQAEDVDAVVERDAERVCILHGPVAARFSQHESEPAADILGSITAGIISRLQEETPSKDLVSGLARGFVSPASWSTISSSGRDASEETSSTSVTSLSELEDDRSLSSGGASIPLESESPAWMRALLETGHLVQDNVRQTNPFIRLLQNPNAAPQLNTDHSELVVTVPGTRICSSVKVVCHNGEDLLIEVYPSKQSEPLRLFYRFDRTNTAFGLSEVMERRNERIKSFYSRLWFEQELDPSQSIDDTFYGQQMTLTQDLLDNMAVTTGSAFSDHRQMTPSSDLLPISSGIVIAWEVISRPLTLTQVDGNLLRLVHRSNMFEYSHGATPLRLGDIVSSKSRVQAVYEDNGGRVVVVEGQIIRAGASVMTVTSTFLFRGPPKDRTVTSFRRVKEERWNYHVTSELEECILRSREWFCPQAPEVSLVGKSITFELETLTTYRHDKLMNLHVTGNAVSGNIGLQQEELATIDFKCEACIGNPVLNFLECRGRTTEPRIEFDTPGWSGRSTVVVQMPVSNEPYAQVSKDFNPVHTSEIFARLAGITGTLCHGMCTSAIAERVLEHLVLEGERERLRRFEAKFTDMVMPQEKLTVQVKHTGMIEGRMRFSITASRTATGERVLEAEAEVEQPKTVYLFTGQGSQSKGMGMDLYSTSAVAKAVWDEIDQQLYDSYGWSVLDIVRNNPKSLTIHFGGRHGRQIRRRYLSITTEVMLPNGRRTQKPVLAGLTAASVSYTFRHPRGLLYSTQFAQPAILLFEAAAFAELHAKGYVSEGAVYAGHSLGEFGALSALSRSIPAGALVELAFYRGSVMQASVAHDDQGATTYGMVAMNPKRVGKYFTQATLGCLVRQIATQSSELLEIVNFNIEGEQYVCSGTAANLYVLGKLIDHIAEVPNGSLAGDSESLPEMHPVIETLLGETRTLPRPIQLQRGKATVPLEGIDVPFHSSHLRNTVDRFRQCLLRPGFLVDNVDVEQLVGRYIPNLMARPFSLDREYIREAFELTGSPILEDMLSDS